MHITFNFFFNNKFEYGKDGKLRKKIFMQSQQLII